MESRRQKPLARQPRINIDLIKGNNMKTRAGVVFILVALATVSVFGHAGEVHTILGTVKAVQENHFVIIDKNGKEVNAVVGRNTKYWKGKATATIADIKAGTRVSVVLSKDGKTATTVRIGVSKPH